MTSPESSRSVALPPRVYSPVAGLLSYLVPGLGQIYQGRVAKGLLFLVCLYALFFYGLYLGEWQDVYVQPLTETDRVAERGGPPARTGRGNPFEVILGRARFLGQVWIGVAAWPAIWQYLTYNPAEAPPSFLGKLERMPPDEEMNNTLRNSDKTPDLGWMYTVIAGALNILVIYDAFAGPAFLTGASRPAEPARPSQEVAVP
jgi:hypothetical protein